MEEMTPRERFIAALERRPLKGLVPTFELVFYLTMEAFGVVYHSHRRFDQWDQMSESEKKAQIKSIAEMYIMIAEHYGHSAIFVQAGPDSGGIPIIRQIREMTGDKYFIMVHGDATYEIPDGNKMLDFSYRLVDEPEKMKQEAAEKVKRTLDNVHRCFYDKGLVDGFALCSDYCLNTGPFLSPRQFSEFVAPYLAELCKGYREMKLYSIKHTDGNIMPIVDQLVQCEPDALHSIDPQAGVSLAEVKRLYGDKVALCGNVNCGLLQTGTEEEVVADVKRSLREGMTGGPGYIFCTSNCVYTGMPLARYELMMKLWREYGIYK